MPTTSIPFAEELPIGTAVSSSLQDHLLEFWENGRITGDGITSSLAEVVDEARSDVAVTQCHFGCWILKGERYHTVRVGRDEYVDVCDNCS